MLFLDSNPELNETDMIIYKYITAHLYEMKKTSIREIADATHTSTASVLRFCKKFGTSGYSEFKVRLESYSKSLSRSLNDTQFTEFEDDLINYLVRAKDTFFKEKIEETVQLLLEKELIVFIGLGSSNIVAEYGALYFSSLFNMAIRIEDPNNYPINYLSPELAERMCIIALSVSGETPELINYLDHLNLVDSSIVSITNTNTSTIARLADINIPYNISVEKINEADITTQIPAMHIIEKLAKEVRKMKLLHQES